MMSFELDQSHDGLEVYLDAEGIAELKRYLDYIASSKDHFHLVIGNELSNDRVGLGTAQMKHVKIVFLSDV